MKLKILGAIFAVSVFAILIWFLKSRSSQNSNQLEIRTTPISISPVNRHWEVDDEVLSMALSRSHSYWSPMLLSVSLHLIRVWSTSFEFPEVPNAPTPYSGEQLLKGLSNNAESRRQQDEPEYSSLFERTKHGIRVTTVTDIGQDYYNGAGHVDQLIAVFGELGISKNTPIIVSDQDKGSVEELINESIARFSLDQEIEWTAIAYSYWLTPNQSWTNRFGESFCFDDLASRVSKTTPGDGACDGIHAYYAASVMLRANEQHDLISKESEHALTEFLKNGVALLRMNELPSGGWDQNWSKTTGLKDGSAWEKGVGKISATGHHLEWIAIAPESIKFPEGLVERSIESLKTGFKTMDERQLRDFHNVWPISHAARALVKLREAQSGAKVGPEAMVELAVESLWFKEASESERISN